MKTMSLNDVPEELLDAAHAAAPTSKGAPSVKFNDQVEVEQSEGDMKYGLTGNCRTGPRSPSTSPRLVRFWRSRPSSSRVTYLMPFSRSSTSMLPNIAFTEIERLVDDDRAVVYEFEGTVDVAPIDIMVTADANEIQIEEGG